MKNINFEIIRKAALKASLGLGVKISGKLKLKNSLLIKVYITSKEGTARVIFLLLLNKNKIFLVILRKKKDKSIGENMTLSNSEFKKLLNRNLDLIFKEYQDNLYKIYNL